MRLLASSGRNSPLEPSEALEVIGEVGHADLDGGTGDADGAHDQAHPVLLSGEHMLDLCADPGASAIGPGGPHRQRPPRFAPLVDMALEHAVARNASFFLETIGRVRQTPEPVFPLLTRSGNRAPSWALAALARQVRIKPCALSMPIWFL